jgi:hypothetical protein
MDTLKITMKQFCEMEKSFLKAKEEQLLLLEEAITCQESEEDLLLYITQAKQTEHTHKYACAIQMLDEYLYRRL